ncbi:hypothetical protein SLS59_008453 [Nothophoma quercina]|uniref:Uncharacterized protein n=1 Tax=Nothophoma quercina TaxID=749835 RepID=A0ABR3QSB1_9PLEO
MVELDITEKAPYVSIQPQDRDDTPPPVLAPKQRTLKDKLGLYNIFVLSLGTVAILLAVGFLVFVWAVAINSTNGGSLPPLWRIIAERKWVSRVVTLCSIVVRVAAAAQLCVFAAIVAALILERVGASTEDLPLLSMIRCANTGPNALIWNVVHTMGTGTQVGYSILITVTILNALVMQFTSTLLLADLDPKYIVLQNVTRDTYFSMPSLDGTGDDGAGAGINPYAGSDPCTTWNASLCVLGAGYGRILDGISPEDASDGGITGATTAQLLLNAIRAPSYEVYFTERNATTLEQQESTAAPWARFGNADVIFDLSLCFINPLPRDYEASAWSASDASSDVATTVTAGKEPGRLVYDTSKIQTMLGVDDKDLSPEQRQLLTLVPPTNWNASRMVNRQNIPNPSRLTESLAKAGADEHMGATYQFVPWSLPEDAMHRSHVALVQHILSKTNNPALALQALWTILLELAYYDVLPLYNIKSPATYGLAREVLIPVQWNCFAAVMGILGLHLVLLSVALVLFVTRSEMSLLGNAWQAVSQVLSTDTADAVHHGAMATDDEVKDTFRGSGVAEGRILIAKSETSGRTEAVTIVRRR